MLMEIKTGDYYVWTEGSTIHYEGTLRLSGTDAYQPILELMNGVLAEKPENVVLDFNSSNSSTVPASICSPSSRSRCASCRMSL